MPSGTSHLLSVPYLAQPSGITCQSTCLKMMAMYFEREILAQSTGAGNRDIFLIWKDINESADRPAKARNAHANMKWWLEKYFPKFTFDYSSLYDENSVTDRVVSFIDGGMPVLMSVSHARVAGHIILVVGYEGYHPVMCSPDFRLVIHDPYGQFDPSLSSALYGKKRYDFGMSLSDGGQIGPGQFLRVPVLSVGRRRDGDAAFGTYYLLSAKR